MPLRIFTFLVAIALAELCGCKWDRGHETPVLGTGNPTSIDLLIAGEKTVITNTEKLVSLMRAGRSTDEHMCTIPGRMFFHYADGTTQEVDILPGHTGTNYEFICSNGYFAVSRDAFLSSLASAGAPTNRIPTPPK
jgi:hypothetical protein